ncbi:OmpH family outer membrane protein [Aquimarina litoralis]|uniref:OmpH family outer membrane protein n=1 Tax=Aquimarina litoralis TaxID=584605 RepID=UPI001C57FC9B|nr:OmpH family outer membrane protein [Aquimarina litoralis]MBW1294602.1 OmpH family outer membrane protein [Aquimarina litoralis]
MKNIIFPVLLLFVSVQAIAQSKVGTIDSDFILSKMPELTKVQEDLKAYNAKLEADLKVKADDYQAKVKAYQEGVASMTEPMKKTKQEEIIALENDIAKFRQNGAQLVQLQQNKLLQPLYSKIGKALEEVAKAEGYTQVLTITSSGLAYVDPKFDLTKTVMTKLGIPTE